MNFRSFIALSEGSCGGLDGEKPFFRLLSISRGGPLRRLHRLSATSIGAGRPLERASGLFRLIRSGHFAFGDSPPG